MPYKSLAISDPWELTFGFARKPVIFGLTRARFPQPVLA